MSRLKTMWCALERLERQRAEAIAAASGGGVLWIPSNGRDEAATEGGRLRLYDIERRKAATEAGADELAALEAALID